MKFVNNSFIKKDILTIGLYRAILSIDLHFVRDIIID